MSDTSLQEGILHVLWAHWSELGVPGLAHGHPARVVDPIALLWFTPFLVGEHDPRLSGFVLGWGAQHGRDVLSRADLTAHRPRVPSVVLPAFDAWCARIHAESGAPWPEADAEPVARRPDERRLPRRDDNPACVVLRARRVFGVSSRADVAVALLGSTGDVRASDLEPLAMSRLTLNRLLADFAAAGLVESWEDGRTHRHRAVGRDALETLLRAERMIWTPWWRVFAIVAIAVDLGRATGRLPTAPGEPLRPPTPDMLDWHRLLTTRAIDAMTPHVRVLGLMTPSVADDPVDGLLAWTLDLLCTTTPDLPRTTPVDPETP